MAPCLMYKMGLWIHTHSSGEARMPWSSENSLFWDLPSLLHGEDPGERAVLCFRPPRRLSEKQKASWQQLGNAGSKMCSPGRGKGEPDCLPLLVIPARAELLWAEIWCSEKSMVRS